MSNLESMLTSDIVSRGAPRVVASTDKMQTLYLDDGESIRPLNGYLYGWIGVPTGTATTSTVTLGVLPKNAAVVEAKAIVTTGFGAGSPLAPPATTSTLKVGTDSGSSDQVAAATSLKTDAETPAMITGTVALTEGSAPFSATARTIKATYTRNGTQPTQGKALVLIRYVIAPE